MRQKNATTQQTSLRCKTSNLIILTLALILLTTLTTAYSGLGDGSGGNPYVILSCSQLQEIKDDLDSNYVIEGDINCTDTINWNGGTGFNTSIGTFTGTLNGNNNTIIDFYQNKTDYAGLFEVNTGTIRDFKITGTIHSTIATETGTIVKENNGNIINVHSKVNLNTIGSAVGGICGTNTNNGHVEKSSNYGNITGTSYVGGICGINGYSDNSGFGVGIINNTYNFGTINTGTELAGGLVGWMYGTDGVLQNSYNAGLINTTNSYNFNGSITALMIPRNAFWFIPDLDNLPKLINTKFDLNTSETNVSYSYCFNPCSANEATTVFYNEDANATGLTTEQMKNETQYAGWDFVNTWDMCAVPNEGYPFLRSSGEFFCEEEETPPQTGFVPEYSVDDVPDVVAESGVTFLISVQQVAPIIVFLLVIAGGVFSFYFICWKRKSKK